MNAIYVHIKNAVKTINKAIGSFALTIVYMVVWLYGLLYKSEKGRWHIAPTNNKSRIEQTKHLW